MSNPVSRFFNQKKKNDAFRVQFHEFQELAARTGSRFALNWEDRHPCLEDKTDITPFDPHYIYHTAWAARHIANAHPAEHVDIASSLYFCSLVSAFVPVTFYDYRPAPLRLSGLDCRQADLSRLLFPDQTIASLSCMHVVEHVGLGRYGDLLDYDGDIKAMRQLERVLAPGGRLYFVVPVGRPRIQFNAHRIYESRQILDAFSHLVLEEFTLIPDDAARSGPVFGCDPALADQQNYGCGCFLFRRA